MCSATDEPTGWSQAEAIAFALGDYPPGTRFVHDRCILCRKGDLPNDGGWTYWPDQRQPNGDVWDAVHVRCCIERMRQLTIWP